MDRDQLLISALRQPGSAVLPSVIDAIRTGMPGTELLLTSQEGFELVRYANRHDHCELVNRPESLVVTHSNWNARRSVRTEHPVMGWLELRWADAVVEVLMLEWEGPSCGHMRWILLHEDAGLLDEVFAAVGAWSQRVEQEILVFDDSYWNRDVDLLEDIRSATFDNLVMPSGRVEALRDDIEEFFNAQELYARFGLPWRRGILLLGPPGNGKTHTIKAIINHFGFPCLYVKSIANAYGNNDHGNIARVFSRARRAGPCFLVFEDLDTLVTPENLSPFLNELDGFATNHGVLTLASTNHPERLDPALVNRPSRFDRKFTFPLPGPEERRAYLEHWNGRLPEGQVLDEVALARLVEGSDGFTFAYLKELFVGAFSQWFRKDGGSLPELLERQLRVLAQEIRSTESTTSRSPAEGPQSQDR